MFVCSGVLECLQTLVDLVIVTTYTPPKLPIYENQPAVEQTTRSFSERGLRQQIRNVKQNSYEPQLCAIINHLHRSYYTAQALLFPI